MAIVVGFTNQGISIKEIGERYNGWVVGKQKAIVNRFDSDRNPFFNIIIIPPDVLPDEGQSLYLEVYKGLQIANESKKDEVEK